MSEIKKGIFIINCLLEPPFGGISKYLMFSLPKISAETPIYGITQRGYPNYGNKEVDTSNFKTKLIRNKNLSFLLLPFFFLRYYSFVFELLLHYKLPLKEVLHTLYFWLPETEAYLKSVKKDIKYIHVYSKPYSVGAVGMYLSKKYNIPMLITTFGELVPHKDEIERLDEYSKKFRKITTDVLNHSSKISSPTKYCQSILNEYSIPTDKVHLTYHVCDIDKFGDNEDNYTDILEKHSILKGKRCVLFIGHMLRRKAPNLIIEAVKEITDLDKDIVFVFIGPDFGFYNELQEIAKINGLEQQCLFLGVVSQKDLFEFYSFADIFIFTTISNIECLGLVFVQAMLSNCAVIASNISGVPEVISHGKNGLMFEPGNVKELSVHFEKILKDEGYKNQLKRSAKESVVKQFDEQIVLQQILDFYK